MKFNQFCDNWVQSTSCPKFTLEYQHNRKNNSLYIKVAQSSALTHYYKMREWLRQAIKYGGISEMDRQPWKKEFYNKLFVEMKRYANRWFEGDLKVIIY